jgi:hypothetical protein
MVNQCLARMQYGDMHNWSQKNCTIKHKLGSHVTDSSNMASPVPRRRRTTLVRFGPQEDQKNPA